MSTPRVEKYLYQKATKRIYVFDYTMLKLRKDLSVIYGYFKDGQFVRCQRPTDMEIDRSAQAIPEDFAELMATGPKDIAGAAAPTPDHPEIEEITVHVPEKKDPRLMTDLGFHPESFVEDIPEEAKPIEEVKKGDIWKMPKKGVEDFVRDAFGVELDRRKNITDMRRQAVAVMDMAKAGRTQEQMQAFVEEGRE